jgi:hypothetical protein
VALSTHNNVSDLIEFYTRARDCDMSLPDRGWNEIATTREFADFVAGLINKRSVDPEAEGDQLIAHFL